MGYLVPPPLDHPEFEKIMLARIRSHGRWMAAILVFAAVGVVASVMFALLSVR